MTSPTLAPGVSDPRLSVVVLAWDQLPLTQACVESIRSHTDVPYELIIVDNGSAPEAAAWVEQAADRAILNPQNLGFAAGMNGGLAVAAGGYVAFANNDTVFPPGWASRLLETFADHPAAGIVCPAVTAAGNPVTVRPGPGTEREVFNPFGELPSGVVYLLRTDVARRLGGWNEDYPVATAEDLDLCFTVWANDLDVVLDTRVLVEHVSRATLDAKLSDAEEVRRHNLARFLARWTSENPGVPRLEECPPEVHARNLRHARTAATWLGRLLVARDEAQRAERRLQAMPKRIPLVSRVRRAVARRLG